MNDEIEIIRVQIPCAAYEAKIVNLIETLLLVDGLMFPEEREERLEKEAA